MDPVETPTFALTAAVAWFDATLLGALGTMVAVLAIAAIGLAMLQGRVPVRRGAIIVLGCFILFSARTIADGVLGVVPGPSVAAVPTPAVATPAYVAPTPPPVPYDPYAGASVPTRAPNGDPGPILK